MVQRSALLPLWQTKGRRFGTTRVQTFKLGFNIILRTSKSSVKSLAKTHSRIKIGGTPIITLRLFRWSRKHHQSRRTGSNDQAQGIRSEAPRRFFLSLLSVWVHTCLRVAHPLQLRDFKFGQNSPPSSRSFGPPCWGLSARSLFYQCVSVLGLGAIPILWQQTLKVCVRVSTTWV